MANVKLLPSYLIMVFYLVHRVSALSCYECSSKEDVTTCGETLAPSHNLEPVNCSHIRNPQYCIKKTGLFEECAALLCYQCSTLKSQFCGVSLPQHVHDPKNKSDYALWAHQAEPCDHVYSARYCIKTTGIYGGVLGTSRFCSSKDFGNYCELVTRPGDERQYYACVYTCSGNACNPASIKKLSVLLLLMSVLLVASH